MELANELRLSYYQELGDLDPQHGVKLVQHTVTRRVFVLKKLKIYDSKVFHYLQAHPSRGIPAIEEIIEGQDFLYVIEEYIPGETLRAKLDAEGSLPEKEAINVVLQLCSILAPLHAQEPPIVHRDIKPSNILINKVGDITLVDFNTAKETDASKSRDTVLIGTAGYAAPEQYGFSSSLPTADIYAIGVLLNELLTGQLPPQGIYPGRLGGIIRNCLQMEPKKRYQSLHELKTALEQYTGYTQPASRPFNPILPPGFRTHSPAKMILASLWYLFWGGIALSLQVEILSGLGLLFARLMCFAIFIIVTFWVCNYQNVWSLMPLSRSDQPFVRLLGVFLWGLAFAITPFFLGILILSIFFG